METQFEELVCNTLSAYVSQFFYVLRFIFFIIDSS